MIVRYTKEVEQSMKDFYDSLSEKDKRRYAAIEAQTFRPVRLTFSAGTISIIVA
jgi:hypothetical protein